MTERIRIAAELPFDAPGGETVTLREVHMAVTRNGPEDISKIVLQCQLSDADWAKVDANGWFHLSPAERGPTFSGSFLPDVPMELEIQLSDASLPLVAVLSEDLFDIGGQFYPDGPPELRQTERWWALTVKQARGPIKTGFATKASGLV